MRRLISQGLRDPWDTKATADSQGGLSGHQDDEDRATAAIRRSPALVEDCKSDCTQELMHDQVKSALQETLNSLCTN